MRNKANTRQCAVCRARLDKSDLIRLVKTEDDIVVVDRTGKLGGRGAYICKNEACLKKAEQKGILNRAFKCNIKNKENLFKELFEFGR